MKQTYRHLRPIVAIVASVVALPLLATVNMPTLARRAVLPIFIVASIGGTFLFRRLRTRSKASRGTFFLCGLSLGLLPAAFFHCAGIVIQQAAPPIAMFAIGIVTGAFGGIALYDLTPFREEK